MSKPMGMAVVIKPTYVCNACCDYCEVYKLGDFYKPMSEETYKLLNKRLEEFLQKPTKDRKSKVTFYWLGGEPLMVSDDFYGFVKDETAKVKNLEISHAIQSNLTPLVKKEFKNLKELLTTYKKKEKKNTNTKIKFHMSTSADPVSDARKLKNGKSYDEAFLKALMKLKKEGAGYGAVYTVWEGSLNHEKEIYYYFKNLGFGGFNINAMCDYTTKFKGDIGMTPKDYGEFLKNMWDIWERDNFSVNITPFKSWKLLRDKGDSSELRCFNDGVCNASLCAVGPNGDVYTCDRAMQSKQLPLGNIKKDSFEEMFEKKVHVKRVEYLKQNDCAGCQWWDYCKGSCPYESRAEYEGSFGKSYWCESYKMLFEHINK